MAQAITWAGYRVGPSLRRRATRRRCHCQGQRTCVALVFESGQFRRQILDSHSGQLREVGQRSGSESPRISRDSAAELRRRRKPRF